MNRKGRKVIIGSAACAVLLAGFLVLYSHAPAPVSALPSPNAYDDFVKASSLLTGDIGNWGTLNEQELGDLLSTNVESLRLLRLGLTRQCALPAEKAMMNVPGMMDELAALKRVAQLLAAEGRFREGQGNLSSAAQSYVDAVHLGNETSRGGFIINRLVGLACEAIGESALSKLVPRLKPAEPRPIIAELERIDLGQVTWEEVGRNEAKFARYQRGTGFNPITWVMSRIESWRAEKRVKTKNKRVVAHLRLITTELALRCYQADKGSAPGSLAQLVPEYLQQIPADPFSEKPLIYRVQTDHWLVYSVGEDGVDDGGQPVGRGGTKGDIFFDSPW